ncbi:MAG TPA: hypothetical protein VJ842_14345 [Pyrinomonadaceae bacterium]|nr:hypothetical protein [Pyrinomonadaceae bacterium]
MPNGESFDTTTKLGMILASNEAALKWAELFLGRGEYEPAVSVTTPGGTRTSIGGVGSNGLVLLLIAGLIIYVVSQS